MLSVGSLQVAKRKSFVLIHDSLTQGFFADETEVLGENGLWVSATNLNSIRNENPSAQYFGLWQVIMHNKLVKTAGVYFVKLGEDSGSATEFKEIDGEIVATRSFDISDSKLNESGQATDDLITLDLDIKKLKLPKIGILKAEEYRATKIQASKNKRVFVGIYIFIMLASFYFYSDFTNEIRLKNEVLENELAINDKNTSNQDQLTDITKIDKLPNDSRILNRMLGVLFLDPDARTEGEQDFSKGVTMFLSSDLSRENRFMKAGESFVRYPTGEFKVVMNDK